ncbi:MAG: BrnT family toxin [Candidatus Rokubacteria bacterium]|nr:BrnT family toxin [Candidatus Rokubacteria bacterium]
MAYVFEWDTVKAASNLQKHGVTFHEAMTVFGDPVALREPDPDHSADEPRHLILGMSAHDRVLVVVFVERFGRLRLISARCANRRERRHYETQSSTR